MDMCQEPSELEVESLDVFRPASSIICTKCGGAIVDEHNHLVCVSCGLTCDADLSIETQVNAFGSQVVQFRYALFHATWKDSITYPKFDENYRHKFIFVC